MIDIPDEHPLPEHAFGQQRDLLSAHVARLRTRSRPRPRRTLVAVAAAALVGAFLVTPASGLGERLLDLIQGTPAPPEVQTHFASSNATREKLFARAEEAGARLHDRFSPVIAAEARGVFALDTADGPIYLWAAPTEDGRQCWLIQAGAEFTTGRPYGFGSCDGTRHESGIRPETVWTAERPSVEIVHVRVFDDAITRVDVELEGMPTVALPVAAGHALGVVAKDERVVALVGRNEEAEEVTRTTLR
jgi:hypothetical protein